jgi:sulfide dehydrogenase cytochrome subunit
MNIKLITAVFLIFSSLSVSNSSLAVEIDQGTMLANSCAACHGTYGKSPGAIPAINGKSASFIVESLKAFQSGARPSTVMGRHASGYSDQEIQLIADFFSKH